MKKVNALKVRTKFGQVLEELRREGNPMLLSRGGEVEAALVPIELFKERFVDFLGTEAVEGLMAELFTLQAKPRSSKLSQLDLRELRGPLL